jgi:hypothetical protein
MFVMLAALGLAASPAAGTGANQRPIIVYGQRIKAAENALNACLARNCRPDEDIDASLALAETQLLDGKYHKARQTLLAALGRNKKEAASYPIPVSDLYRANGRVAAHLGLDGDYQYSTWSIYRILKRGLPPEDVRRFSALMEVAEMAYRTRGHERARGYYEAVASQARKAGRPDIAALAELRSAIRHLPPNSSWQVHEINRIASLQGPEMRAPVLEAKLALARRAFSQGDEAGGQAIVNDLATLNIKRPILLYSPPYDSAARDSNSVDEQFEMHNESVQAVFVGGIDNQPPGTGGGGTVRASSALGHGGRTFASRRVAPVVDDMWLDVAFRITPEGRVADLRVARSHGGTYWAKPLLRSIEGRRYTPADPASKSALRLERYTYTSGYERKTDTRSAGHSPETRVEFVDLSDVGGLADSE